MPENIFLSTFTEKASNELISRISKKIKNSLDISQMYIGTIHSLCHRIIEENIFLSTFTEKASNELISRISKKIKNSLDISQMYIGTIHSLCHRIIDENLEYSFLEKNYRIFDDLEQRFFIYSKLKHFEKIDGYKDFMIKNGGWK